jgi:hypothetical protein
MDTFSKKDLVIYVILGIIVSALGVHFLHYGIIGALAAFWFWPWFLGMIILAYTMSYIFIGIYVASLFLLLGGYALMRKHQLTGN